jgi:acyl-CoA thioesterase-2
MCAVGIDALGAGPGPGGRPAPQPPSLADLLQLEEVTQDLYRTTAIFDDPFGLYGGQVAAQALRAASGTVSAAHRAHSLHGYFVRPGNPRRPVVFSVYRDHDGRSYAARRVIAQQNGAVILNLAASFHIPESGPDLQSSRMPEARPPGQLAAHRLSTRVPGVDFRDADPGAAMPVPARIWARADGEAGDDPHLAACMLTYVSDMFTGLFTLAEPDEHVSLVSLDHALWFYRPVPPGWLLMDLTGESVANGRGMYTGRIFDADGVLIAGLAQESLFRRTPAAHPRRISRTGAVA